MHRAVRGTEAKTVFGDVAAAREALWTARRAERRRIVSVSWTGPDLDALDVYEDARNRGEEAMFWQQPSEEIALVGVGAAAVLQGRGRDRFAQVAEQWRRLAEGAVAVGDIVGEGARDGGSGGSSGPRPGPVAMGGFAFVPGGATDIWSRFGDGRLVLPRVVYGAVRGFCWWTVNFVVDGTTNVDEAAAALEAEMVWAAAFTGGENRLSGGAPGGAPGVVPGHDSRVGDEAGAAAAGAPGGGGPLGAGGGLPAEDAPPKGAWLAAVERVAGAIRAGRLEKAVLSRSVRVPVGDGFSETAALRRLRVDYPETYVFAVAGEAGCFLGATPERIAHLARSKVHVACMAGSIGRGATEQEDRELGRRLLADPKNVEEHLVVLRSILNALEPVCDDVAAGDGPELRRFANVQHLYTPVTARAKAGVDVLQLVSRVHPTPAIGGHPTEEALKVIAREEGGGRGWYAGPVGWMDAAGDGEFVVALRSGIVRDGEARLFAGCGIMGDSDPESEYTESELKLRPMMRALEAGIR